MKRLIIKKKESNSGSIHDIRSTHYDRVIKFKANELYAVVLASYYGGNIYTTHRSETAAVMVSGRLESSHKIIDADGEEFRSDGTSLIATHHEAS